MSAIYKRELKAYFHSPIGYVFLSVLYFFSGLFFYTVIGSQSADASAIVQSLFTVVMVLIPILTMRIMSEDKRQKTDQLLFTSPTSLFAMVMGKYLASLTVFFIGLSINLVFVSIIAFFGTPEWLPFLGSFFGMFLLGATMIAIGVFISSLTESQFVAAIGTFGISLFIILLDGIAQAIPWQWLKNFAGWISFSSRYNSLMSGVLNYAHAIFFFSVAAVFIFLTVRTLDRKRWS